MLLFSGNQQEESWQHTTEKSGFYQLSRVVQSVLEATGLAKEVQTEELSDSSWQYGLQWLLNTKPLVKAGAVAPAVAKLYGVKQEVYYAEFDWALLNKHYRPQLQLAEIPRFPEVRRDLSLVLPNQVSYRQIVELANKTESKLLQRVNVFDVYTGKPLEENQKSYSVSFHLQDADKTLTDKVIDKSMNKLMQAFERELQAVIRR